MQVIKEAKKEKLPISFLTDFISNGWATIGGLKEDLTFITKECSGTEEIAEVIQSIIDAYYVGLGQIEQLVGSKKATANPIKAPVEKETKTETLKEDVQVLLVDTKPAEEVIFEPEDTFEDEIACMNCKPKAVIEPSGEDFEFYTDFDDPVGGESIDMEEVQKFLSGKNL